MRAFLSHDLGQGKGKAKGSIRAAQNGLECVLPPRSPIAKIDRGGLPRSRPTEKFDFQKLFG